jgi:hypothetical protein
VYCCVCISLSMNDFHRLIPEEQLDEGFPLVDPRGWDLIVSCSVAPGCLSRLPRVADFDNTHRWRRRAIPYHPAREEGSGVNRA